ncbi:MAG TPA: dTMP kinase [Candidatus Ornithoclostridium faecavium]|nr:dTMP kinase [Candidatus Ornithoclostridium faecavium]
MKGSFITFEGCEGVGKTTQVDRLKRYLEKSGQPALFLREPGGTVISEKIREMLLSKENDKMNGKCEALLYSAARAQLLGEVVAPALEKGSIVVCDRFTDSTFAYQGAARGLGVDFIDELNKLTCGDIVPDVTVFLDLHPREAFARKGGADKNDRLESQSIEFHEKVYLGYKEIASRYPERFICVDASKDADGVWEEVIALLRRRTSVK